MKRTLIFSAIITAIVVCSFAFRNPEEIYITGKVIPGEGVTAVWAINKSDSVKAELDNGTFALTVKAGTYTVLIDAAEPYKDVTRKNIKVSEKKPKDLGEIMLKK